MRFQKASLANMRFQKADDREITIYFQGRIDSTNASQLIELFDSLIKDRKPVSLTIDLKKVIYLDDFGALVLVELRDMMTAAKGQFNLKNAREEVLFILNSGVLAETPPLIKIRHPSMFIRFGDAILKVCSGC